MRSSSLVHIFILGTCILLSAGEEALYGPSDHVVLLNRDNIASHIIGSPTAWILEFYSSWCGHCIRFAPTFKKFAGKVAGWSDFIRVGVLDCADETNTGTCRDYGVGGYPTLKFFPPHAPNSSKGLESKSYLKSIESLMKDTSEFAASQKELSRFFPKMEFARESSKAFEGHPGAKVAVFLNPSKYKYGPSLFLSLRQNLSSSDVPLYLSSKESILASVLVRGEKILRSLSIRGKDLEEDARTILARLQEMNVVGLSSSGGEEVTRRRYRVYMSDLEKAILYALKQEVSAHADIVGDKLLALKTFLEILFKYFPGRKDTRHFLGELKAWTFSHEKIIKGAEFERQIGALSERLGVFGDTPKDWVGCKGSTKRYGGYPCSLWMLFHTLSVNHAGVTSDGVSTKLDVLESMRLYVREFFGCKDCARHFEQEWQGDLPSKSVSTAEDAILWLWRTHNKVNARLSGDPSDDPSFPKKTFPDAGHCPKCYPSDTGQTLLFLKDLYGKDISFAGLSSSKVTHQPPHKLSSEGLWFTSLDVSLILILNVAAVGLILCICRKLVFKRKCKLLSGTLLNYNNV